MGGIPDGNGKKFKYDESNIMGLVWEGIWKRGEEVNLFLIIIF